MAKLLFLSLAVVFFAAFTFAEDPKNQDIRTKNPSLLRAYDVDPKDEPAKRPSKSYDMEDPSDLDDEAMSADLGLEDEDGVEDEKKPPTSFDMGTVSEEQDKKIRDIRKTLDKLEKNPSSTVNNQDTQPSQDENEDAENDESDDMTPAERALLRRFTRTRRIFYPAFPTRYFDANNEDQEGESNMMDGSNMMAGAMEGNMPMDPSMMNNMNQQSMMGQQDGVVLRIPKHILKKLIRKFGSSGSRNTRRHSRRSSKRTSGLRLVRLVPIVLPMSNEMDQSV